MHKTNLNPNRIVLGYVDSKSGVILPLDDCSFKLANHGEGGTPSEDYGFTCIAGKAKRTWGA